MAKKVTGYIKLQIPAGKATPAPPVGPALGQHGVNIVQFTKEFNARTADQGDPKHQRNHFLSSSSVLFSITILFLKFCITRIDSSIFTIYMMERDQFR